MARRRLYESNADRQRAYRARKRDQDAAPPAEYSLTASEAAEIVAFLEELTRVQLWENARVSELIGRLSP